MLDIEFSISNIQSSLQLTQSEAQIRQEKKMGLKEIKIQEIAERHGLTGKKDLEIIEFPTKGKEIVFLRSRSMPEYAFVVWSQYHNCNSRQITISLNLCHDDYLPERPDYSLVSTSDSPESTLTPVYNKTHKLGSRFGDMVAEFCRKNGISTIFVDKEGAWGKRFGNQEELSVVGFGNHYTAFQKLYDEKTIKESLLFLREYYLSFIFGI